MTRILIVEDDTNIARLLQTTLAMAGYESDCCGDGASAIEKVFAQPFDLVLLDVMLPQADGFTVMEKIRSQDVPVIFLTAMQDTMDELQSAVDLCSEASDTIDSIVDSLQSAAG